MDARGLSFSINEIKAHHILFWFKGGILKIKQLLLTGICTYVHLIFSRNTADTSEEGKTAYRNTNFQEQNGQFPKYGLGLEINAKSPYCPSNSFAGLYNRGLWIGSYGFFSVDSMKNLYINRPENVYSIIMKLCYTHQFMTTLSGT